ncbi:MAG: glycoside hydrolase family 3 C-terminal domain-containing protein [Microbacteriaceae bacterium]|nr:glycoside hydrolase family 3 C-terminal domain-containing protein [Microbacteriaceae bacterium]MCL2795530.1 glycoside hydrolase family 3 C-terminal domain-containing protein [Microbacteriaceae bacterium]
MTTTEGGAPAAMPIVSERVAALHAQMTLEEKLAQLVGYWLDQNGVVAPMQGEMSAGQKGSEELSDITKDGLGQYTRVYGTRPVEPADRAAWLWNEQRRLKRETRLGIPALVHEECLTGLAAWKAATFPTPLAWGASFDPELVEEVGAAIGRSMAQLGIHQGLAPVVDVISDPRWGRVDECIGEDPYLVGTVGTAYVKGLQSEGIHATLKHFVGYSRSRAGRNHAPVFAGPREVADRYLPPFEMAIADGGVKSVMNAYVDVDGIPMAAHEEYLTDVLRERLGFDGVVVADYFAVAFLEVMHAVAADRGEAAALALTAGIDIELPTGDAYLEPLANRIRAGEFDEAYVDRAVLRFLRQKEELGLLEPDVYEDEPPTDIDLDSPEHQRLARKLAEESIVLLSNDGVLPLAAPAKVAVIGPNAHRAEALQGCYSFANHVLAHHPGYELGFEIPTVFEALPQAFAGADAAVPELVFAAGSDNESADTSGFAEATDAAASADVAIVVVGDQAGLFGRGTVGEGNDAESLELPGVQRELVEAVVATGTPTVLVLLTGRPYAVAWALDGAGAKPAAVLQAFFPGEGGGLAIADVITGAANPSGRLPVSMPRSTGAQPYTYSHPILGGSSDVTSTDSTPTRPFGYGLGYTSFAYSALEVESAVAAGGVLTASVTVSNTGERAGADVVQLYGHDVHGSIVRPTEFLVGYARVELEAGASARVSFTVPTARFAFTDRSMTKVVEPGDVELWVAAHAGIAPAKDDAVEDSTGGAIVNDKKAAVRDLGGAATPRKTVALTGEKYAVTLADARVVGVSVSNG